MSMPPNSTEGAARAEQADRVEEMELESVLPKTGKQPTGPGAAITLVARRSPGQCRRRPGLRSERHRLSRHRRLKDTPGNTRRCPKRYSMNQLQKQDPDVWQAIANERRRQQEGLEMIASENYTSPAVMAAQGRADQQVCRGLSRAGATTAAASSSMSSNGWPSTACCKLSAPSAPMSSRTPAPRPTWRVYLRLPAARRHDPGHGPGPRRPSDPRHAAQFLRQALQGRRLRRHARTPSASTSTRSPSWPASTSRS